MARCIKHGDFARIVRLGEEPMYMFLLYVVHREFSQLVCVTEGSTLDDLWYLEHHIFFMEFRLLSFLLKARCGCSSVVAGAGHVKQ